LQSYFIQRLEKFINSKGRQIIGWDEILEGGLAPNASVMSWRGEQGGIDAANEHHYVVMTPGSHVYFDHSQSKSEDSITIGGYTSLEKVYSYEPIPAVLTKEKHQYILGAQANLWSEYIKSTNKAEYMLFPRLSALSEVLWSPKEKRDYEKFQKKLPAIFQRYQLWGNNYSKAYYDIFPSILPSPDHDGVIWSLSSKANAQQMQFFSKENGKEKALPYTSPIVIKKDGEWSAFLKETQTPGSEKVISQTFTFNKATGKKINLKLLPTARYPGNGGAFGLINGARSSKGIASSEWLGWEGGDCEAVIDLITPTSISQISVHTLEQTGSWVYAPRFIEIWYSSDGIQYQSLGKSEQIKWEKENMGLMTLSFPSTLARYVKILVKAHGIIEDGKPGAGNHAWLFTDEIEVN